MDKIKVDRKDHQIIKILRENANLSLREIALKASIKPSTVHQRIQRLIKNKVIEKFTLKLNNSLAGEGFIVFILLSLEKALDDKALKQDCIKEAFGITGEYNTLIKMKFSSLEDFNDYITGFRKNNEINKLITIIATNTIKEEL